MLTWKDIIHWTQSGNPQPPRRVEFSNEKWKTLLSSETFQITRLKGTERPFSSEMCHLFEPGKYACTCCKELLFDSVSKFDSGTGWPSFSSPVSINSISYHMDKTYGMIRVETLCSVCDAHLGHVFPDGPAPSGLRYCINALALIKV